MLKKMTTVRTTIVAVLAGLSMSALALADTARAINVPAGDLVAALESLAKQADIQLVYQAEQLRGIHTDGVNGTYEPKQAVSLLLKGTQLTIRTDEATGVMLVAPAASKTSSADDSSQSQSRMEVEEIIVTGTHIRVAGDTPSPVYSFDREDFAKQGADTVQQVLRNLPQNFTGGASEQAAAVSSTRSGAGGNTNLGYGASVNLRGLGTESTLVLLNGRRLAPGGLGNFVDISTIPLSAIERIEVVPDGASAVYGSDAVGGVVNFMLREDFEGAETQVRYGGVTDGSLRQLSASQLLGTTWSSGSVMANLDYGDNEPLLASERPFATGLQNGISYLSPSYQRKGLMVSGDQDLTSSLRVAALVYANERDVDNRAYQTTSARQYEFNGTTEQIGGTLSLEQSLGETWLVSLAYSEDRNDSHRFNYTLAADTLPGSRSEVRTEHEVSAAELEAEGALFDLPAGQARLAVGAERREEALEARRVNVAGAPFTPKERDVVAGYAELFVPVIGAANATRFAQQLNLTLAGRYEDYSDVGGADTWKAGVLWSPVDGVNLRATWGTSFRAPYLYQYDTSQSVGAVLGPPLAPLRIAYVQSAPAPDLGPENATIWSTGFDIDQDVVGVKVSATYFDIRYKDRIRAAPASTNLADPFLSALFSIPPDPEILAAVEQAVQLLNLTGQPVSAAQATFDSRVRNQGLTELSGVDLTIERNIKTRWGEFSTGVNASKLLEFDASATDTAPMVSILDTIFNPISLRLRGHLSWSRGNWSAATFANYVDDYVDNQRPAAWVAVSSWTTFDLSVGYRLDESIGWLGGLVIRANAQNVFDKDPPHIVDRAPTYGNPGYDTENANPLGRIVSLSVSKVW